MFWSVFGAVGELDQAAVEEVCGGNFVQLRKSYFLLTGAEAPLLAKVRNYNWTLRVSVVHLSLLNSLQSVCGLSV